MILSSTASSPSSPRAARRGRWTPTGATCSTSSAGSGGRSRRRRPQTCSRTSPGSEPTVSRGTTISRRISAIRSFFAHQVMLGTRGDNPAAELEPPRRRRKLPRTLSPREAERLIEAAAGTQPRALRDAALVELLYGAGLRVSEAVGLERAGVDLDERLVRCIGKGGKERVVPIGRSATEALRRYLSRGRPYLDRRYRPELFLNAQGGALTRAGAFLILRRLAEKAGSRSRARPPAPAPPFVRHPPARGRRRPAHASRRCSATPTWRRPSCTRTSPTAPPRDVL